MNRARTLVAGEARGPALVLDEPLSFWGGVDPATGDIVDVHHPQRDANVAGCVLIMPSGRGSSSSSSVLAEAIRAGTAPVAIVIGESDPILALGAIVARELYGRTIPVVVAPTLAVRTGDVLTVRARPDGVRID
jgi:predicted aconitase with swiveling domain